MILAVLFHLSWLTLAAEGPGASEGLFLARLVPTSPALALPLCFCLLFDVLSPVLC